MGANYRVLVYCTCPFQSGSLLKFSASTVCWSLQCLISSLTQGGAGGHFFRLLFSRVWGGRNTANKYHGCVWGVLAVMQPRWVCPGSQPVCFPRLHCSGSRLLCRNCLMRALGGMHFPGLSHSGSDSRVLHKGADLVGRRLGWTYALCPSQVWETQVASFLGVQWACLLRCAMCLFWGADLWLWHSQGMSTIRNPIPWMARKSASSLVDDASLGPIAPFSLWLPLPACLWQGKNQSTAG